MKKSVKARICKELPNGCLIVLRLDNNTIVLAEKLADGTFRQIVKK